MYGAVGTSAEVTSLATLFLPPQVANAVLNGLNPQVYATEALGVVFAFNNEDGSTGFANGFGPGQSGHAEFCSWRCNICRGSFNRDLRTGIVSEPDRRHTNLRHQWKAFYSANGVVGISHGSADQIDLAARGAAWGDAVGVALANNLGPVLNQFH
jgi:hypothetical protein